MQTVMNALSISKPESLPEVPEPLAQRWIARVFDSLIGQLGAKVADLYAGVPAETVQAEWAAGLAGFTVVEVDRGVAACRTRAFAPTLGEFATLCRPALDAEFAWLEAAAGLRERDAGRIGEWTHPAVFRAACRMSREVQGGDFRQLRKRWSWTLARELAVGFGDGVPLPAVRVAHVVKVGPPSNAVRQRIADLMSKPRQVT